MNSNYLAPDARHSIAAALIDSGCVSVRTDEPFRLPSGWASPVYMDCRRLISFPEARREVLGYAIKMLRESGCLDGLDGVAGGESSGIALAAWVADELNLPMQYVRKRPAGDRPVEGVVRNGDKVLLIDDVMAVGQSKVRFCKALHAVGAHVRDILVVFRYDTFPAAAELDSTKVRVHALATWQDVLEVARERRDFPEPAIEELQVFLKEPISWSQAHGGLGPEASGRM